MPKYDERLLLNFANRFLGYGSLKSDVWLIGPEAGGGQTIDEVYERAIVWSQRGEKETDDLHGYHADLLLPVKHDWTRNIQPTWGPLIKIVLAFGGNRADTEDVRDFQKRELGRANGQNCVLDLSPLLSPSQAHWKLAEFGFSWLRTREECEAHLIPPRCDLLRAAVTRYKPKLVLFYGLPHRRWWEHISARRLTPSGLHGLSSAHGENTLFAMIPHPNGIRLAGVGAVTRFLVEVGTTLRAELR
jgi:hypothetical protein